MTEQQFTNEILKWAKTYGFRRFHVRNSGAKGISQVQGDKGFPDCVLVRGNRWIAAELKVGKVGTKAGDARPEQSEWLTVLQQVGAETYVWRPEMWSDILAILSKR